jgi:uncharacterized membrane protein
MKNYSNFIEELYKRGVITKETYLEAMSKLKGGKKMIFLIPIILFLLLFLYSCCVVASKADQAMENEYEE